MIHALLALLLVVASGLAADVADATAAGFSGRVIDDYRIGAGDVLDVQVYGEPTLSGSFAVGDSGELSFPLIGVVRVRGRTTEEVAATLVNRLSPDFLVNANVTVQVSDYGSQPVQVLGAVANPGVYHLRGPTTLLEILGEAGGVLSDGVNEIRITSADNVVRVVWYKELLQEGTERTLNAGDVVFVPESRISVMGEVGQPGEIAFREGLTLSQSIAAAGGLLPTGSKRRVFILRGEEQIRVDLASVLSGEETDVLLEPGDGVFVKRAFF